MPRPAEILRAALRRLGLGPSAPSYRMRPPGGDAEPATWDLAVCAPRPERERATTWIAAQTLPGLRVAGQSSGEDPGDSEESLFYAPGDGLPEVDPAFAETAALVLAAESVD
ncbi:MAG: hypothetical protein AAF725_27040, partial [Acidobacteriota bacterium]